MSRSAAFSGQPPLLPARLWLTGFALLAAAAAWLRLSQRHASLLYPDAYQYLLQARGIGEHLRPLTRLGPGGELFVPSADAADKPLYPALIAAGHTLGLSAQNAAGLLTALAAAAVPLLVALVVRRLSGSALAALAAAAVLLASSAFAYWSGFLGPDPLAQALALAAVLALLRSRPALAGTLAGLAALSRPEYLLLVLAALAAAGLSARLRPAAGRAALSLTFTLAVVVGVLRPPLALPPAVSHATLAVALPGAPLLVLAAWQAARSRTLALAALLPLGALALVGSERLPAFTSLWHSDAPLLALAALALPVAAAGRLRRETLLTVAAAVTLAGSYLVKNPSSERYLVQLWPLAALVCGFALAGLAPALARRPLAAAVLAAALAATVISGVVLAPSRPAPDAGFLPVQAAALAGEHSVLYSATPDAYGLLLPRLGQRPLRAGASGLVLLDAAQRYYQPHLHVQGALLIRLHTNVAFVRPDGRADRRDAQLYRGRILGR